MNAAMAFGPPLLNNNSNLTLIVGDPQIDQRRFKVTIEQLRLASKVFNAMLRPDSPFLKPGGEVVLPDDEPDSLRLCWPSFTTTPTS